MATWTAGTALGSGALITQAWVQNVVNNQKFLAANDATYGKDLAFLRRTTSLALTASTYTSIPFDTEDIDVADGHSTTTNTSRYTAKAAGKYRLSGALNFGGLTSNPTVIGIFAKNGSRIFQSGIIVDTNGSNRYGLVLPTTYTSLVAGDYVELQAYTDSTAGTINPSQGAVTFGIEWVGA